jgi:NADH:ubiquinone oxidoreductase subunit E
MERLISILARYPKYQRDNLIPILQDVQEAYGYITEESIIQIGKHLLLSTSKIYGTASFYDNLRFSSKGKFHVEICHGTSCHLIESGTLISEAEKILKIKIGQVTRDGMFSLEKAACLGACGAGPVMTINGEYHEKVDVSILTQLIENLKNS